MNTKFVFCLFFYGTIILAENNVGQEKTPAEKGILSDAIQQVGAVFIKEAVEEVVENVQEYFSGDDKDKKTSNGSYIGSTGRIVWSGKGCHIMLNVEQANAFDNALARNFELSKQLLADAILTDPKVFGYNGKNTADLEQFFQTASAAHKF